MKLAALLLIAVPAFAQFPDYITEIGYGYITGTPTIAAQHEAYVSAYIHMGGGVFNKTTVDDKAQVTTLRTGFCKEFATQGEWHLGTCVDVGASNTAPVSFNFNGGMQVAYSAKWMHGWRLAGTFQITGAPGVSTVTTTSVNSLGVPITTTTTTGGVPNQVGTRLFGGIQKVFFK